MVVGVKQPARPAHIGVMLLGLIPLVLAGCFTASREAVKVEDGVGNHAGQRNTQTTAAATARRGRDSSPDSPWKTPPRKASFQKTGDTGHARGKPELTTAKSSGASGKLRNRSPSVAASLTARVKPEKKGSEDEYVREVARKLADEHSAIKKIKICFDAKEEEWWIVLYQDAGSFYDLKQFVWNIYLDKPEPFLVVERVSRRGLKDHLKAQEPNRRCRVIEPRKAGLLAALAGSDVWDANTKSAEGLRDRRPDRKRQTSARPSDSSAARPRASKPQSRRVKAVRQANPPRGDRTKARSRSSFDATCKESAQAGMPSLRAVDREPHQIRPYRVRPERRTNESGFVSTEAGALRSHHTGSKGASPRLSLRESNRTLSQAQDNETVGSVSTARRASGSGPVPSLPGNPPNASSRDSLLKPTYRTASAGPGEGAKTSATVIKSREERSAKRPPRVSTLTVRSDHLEGTEPAVPTGRHESEAVVPTYFVFAYGSKMNHPKLLRWLKTHGYDASMILDATPGILEGYDYVWNSYSPTRGGGVVNLEPKENSKVWGLLIEFQDPLLQAFDEREGHPIAYSRGRKRVAVTRTQDGKTVFAWLYLANAHERERRNVWPTKEYKNTIIQAARFWEFPEDYVRKLEAWKTR